MMHRVTTRRAKRPHRPPYLALVPEATPTRALGAPGHVFLYQVRLKHGRRAYYYQTSTGVVSGIYARREGETSDEQVIARAARALDAAEAAITAALPINPPVEYSVYGSYSRVLTKRGPG